MSQQSVGNAASDDIPAGLLGSWRLTSYTSKIVGEDTVIEPLGPAPKGNLVLTPERRWIIVITAGNRKAAVSNDEKAALLGSMLAYTGRFTIEGETIVTDIDTSWNEVFTGRLARQTRFFKVEGDTLTIRTPEIESAVYSGKKITGTLLWSREK